jgi:hypothetical protein
MPEAVAQMLKDELDLDGIPNLNMARWDITHSDGQWLDG